MEKQIMSKTVNKVLLLGNVGKDPEIASTNGGTLVAKLSLATSERFKDKQGEWQERTEWHKIVAWDRLGEICKEYLSKGKLVYIEGRISTRSFKDREGNDRKVTEIVAQTMRSLDHGGSDSVPF